MRVIRPAVADPRRARGMALALVTIGIAAVGMALGARAISSGAASATLGLVAALALGIGAAWLVRGMSRSRSRSAGELLARLLAPAFDDSYTLVLGPVLPIRDTVRLDGLLIGPAGVRAMTVRDWDGRYRVRRRAWEYDAGRRRGWIPTRTNPGRDAAALAVGVTRWAEESGLPNVPVRGAVAFPLARSRLVLEEPEDEIVTSDNGPWWANAIGRARRLEASTAAALLHAVLDASEAASAGQRGGSASRQSA